MTPIIMDGKNVAYIQRHALGTELTYQDEHTGVLWGFFNNLFSLAKRFETHSFIFAWDSRRSMRKLDFPDYKAQRHDYSKMTETEVHEDKMVKKQFDLLFEELLPMFGFKNLFWFTGFEADDIIAKLVLPPGDVWTAFVGGKPLVVSTDKDLYQLLPHCNIFRPLPGDKKEVFTDAKFRERYDINPDQWVEVRAMEGDQSDNIPGIEGVGPTTAIKFLKNQLPIGGAARSKILSSAGQAIIDRNKKLMLLPYPETPDIMVRTNVEQFKVDDFLRICDKYGFRYFQKPEQLAQWRKLFKMV